MSERIPKDIAEWARAVFEWWRSQRKDGERKSEEAFAAEAKISRQGFRHITDGRRKNPHIKTLQKLNAFAPKQLKRFDIGQPSGSTGMSDPPDKLMAIREALGDALGRRTDSIPLPDVEALNLELAEVTQRLGEVPDPRTADTIVGYALKAIEQRRGSHRG